MGTLQYLAPEVLQKQATTAATDVYAWAVTVNEVATGVFPFSDASKDDPRAQTILEYGYDRHVPICVGACSASQHHLSCSGMLAEHQACLRSMCAVQHAASIV